MDIASYEDRSDPESLRIEIAETDHPIVVGVGCGGVGGGGGGCRCFCWVEAEGGREE
jgi:D-serine dehydratase